MSDKTNVDLIYQHAPDWVRHNCRNCLFGFNAAIAIDDDDDKPKNCDVLVVLTGTTLFTDAQASLFNGLIDWQQCPLKVKGTPQSAFTRVEYLAVKEREAALLASWAKAVAAGEDVGDAPQFDDLPMFAMKGSEGR